MTTLDETVAIVTGGGRGLGREHALLLAKLGARVVVNDNGAGSDGVGRDDSPAQQVVNEIVERGGEAVAHIGSVADWDSARRAVQLAVDTFGRLDVLVNNAGILRDRFLVNMTEDDWDLVMEVHLKGHFCALRHAAAYWRSERKAGREVRASVINTSSGSGLRGNAGQVNYASAKAGIASMTLVAARELERFGVRVNAIAPVARTRLTESAPGLKDRIAGGGPDGFDVWDPGNVSPLVAWLANPDCQVSGQVFSVHGGHIGLQRGWVEEEAFDHDRRWTLDELSKQLASVPSAPPAWVPTA